MSEAVVAKRYADALFQLGMEKTIVDQYVDSLHTVQKVFQENKELNAFLEHPRVDKGKKKELVKESFKDLHADVVNVLQLLIERGRQNLVVSFVKEFDLLVNEAKGIAEGIVYSVRELSEAEKAELGITFAKHFNKSSIQLINVVDPSILGGVKIRVGNTIVDGTISGKLKRIERSIVTANI